MRKIKVLQILTSMDFGGVEKYVQLLVRHLDPQRFEVAVAASPRGKQTALLRDLKVDFYPVPHFRKAIVPWSDLLALWELHRLLGQKRFDIVHTHMFKASVLGRLAAKVNGVPAILFTAHGFHYNTFRNPLMQGLARVIEKYMARYCSSAVLTVSRTEAAQARRLDLIPSQKLRTVYPGIEIKALDVKPEVVAACRQRFGLNPGHKIIGTVGRLARQKAPLDLVRAARHLRDRRGDFHVLFVGDGPLRGRVEQAARKAGLERHVHVLGYCREVDSLLSLMDVFALPSLYEGQPISIMEAMLSRVPVVATDVDGVGEIVRDGVTGSLVPPSDPASLCAAILELLSDDVRRARYVDQAEKHLKTNYAVGSMVSQIQDIYLELMREVQSPCAAYDSSRS